MYPAMAKIRAATTPMATITPIATVDNPSLLAVCWFVASSSVLLKVKVAPDDDKDEVVTDAVNELAWFEEAVSRCLVIDTDFSDSELSVVIELEYIVCVVEYVFSSEVIEAIAGGESVVWDNDCIVDSDVDITNVGVNVVDITDVGVDGVDRGSIATEVDGGVVSVLVQSVQSNALDEAKHCQQLLLLLNVPFCMQVPFM